MSRQTAHKTVEGNWRRQLLAYLLMPALWSCATQIPQAKFDPIEGASPISGIIRIVADEDFRNYSFHTQIKRLEKRCLFPERPRFCQYEDVVRKVDIDIGSSSMRLFQDSLRGIFDEGLISANGGPTEAIDVVPSVSASGSYEEKDDWWLYVMWNNRTQTCDTSIRYSILVRNPQGDTEEVSSDWHTGKEVIKSIEAIMMSFLLFPFNVANLFSGRDAIVTACFSKAFAQAESKAFSNLLEKLNASKILHTLAAKK